MPDPDALLPLADSPAEGLRRVRCRDCGRPLYGRLARLRGRGDDCWAKLQERSAPRPGGWVVEQDELPGV